MRSPAIASFSLCALLALTVGGCAGGEDFAVAPVKGKVLVAGKPVSEGIVQFTPVGSGDNRMPGKTAAGEIGPNGEFVLSTYKLGDGAVIGVCRITAGASDPRQAWAHELRQSLEYEVKAGENEVVIEILPGGAGKVSVLEG